MGILDIPPAISVPGIEVPTGWGALSRTKIAAAKANTGKFVVGVIGDSVARGMMAADMDLTGWVGLLRSTWQSIAGDGGSGFHGVCDWSSNIASAYSSSATYPNIVVTSTGSWANVAPTGGAVGILNWRAGLAGAGYNDGPGGNLLVNWAAVGGAAVAGTLTFKVRGSAIRVFYAQNTGFSGGTVSVDGAAAQTLPTSASPGIGAYSPTGVSGSGVHTVVITATSGGYTGIFGVSGENTNGVRVDNYSRPGAASGWFSNLNNTYGISSEWSGGKQNPADLLIWSLGINDALMGATATAAGGTAITEATYALNLRSWLMGARESVIASPVRSTPVDLMIVIPHFGQADLNNGFTSPAFAIQARRLAITFGAAFIDFNVPGKNSWAYWNSLGYWGNQSGSPVGVAGTDSVHPGTAGMAYMANQIKAAVPSIFV